MFGEVSRFGSLDSGQGKTPHARSGGRREPGIIFLEFGYMLGGINYLFISVDRPSLERVKAARGAKKHAERCNHSNIPSRGILINK